MATITNLILQNLVKNPEYVKRVAHHLKEDHFKQAEERILFRHIKNFIDTYHTPPTFDILYVELTNDDKIEEHQFSGIDQLIGNLKNLSEQPTLDWLYDSTEGHVKKRELELALQRSIRIQSGIDRDVGWGAIPDILSKALSISFDSSIGHDYLEDALERFAYYHRKENKTAFEIGILNDATLGGVNDKTLNVVLSGPHGGKTAMLCNLAGSYLRQNKNVLYITLEMAAEEIAKRVDANLLDIELSMLTGVPQTTFEREINALKLKVKDHHLKIKEYGPGECSATHIRALLNDLKLKKGFTPDVILVDYLGLMASSRFKNITENLYAYGKAISEELRGIGVDFKVPVWTASQFNRQGSGDSDPTMASIAESFGVVMTADFCIALISSEELKQKQQMLCKQLKNRYHDLNAFEKFLIGFDRSRMRFHDLAQPTRNVVFRNDPIAQQQNDMFDAVKTQIEEDQNRFGAIDFN